MLSSVRPIIELRLSSRMQAAGTGRSSTLRRTLGELALRDASRSGTCPTTEQPQLLANDNGTRHFNHY